MYATGVVVHGIQAGSCSWTSGQHSAPVPWLDQRAAYLSLLEGELVGDVLS